MRNLRKEYTVQFDFWEKIRVSNYINQLPLLQWKITVEDVENVEENPFTREQFHVLILKMLRL